VPWGDVLRVTGSCRTCSQRYEYAVIASLNLGNYQVYGYTYVGACGLALPSNSGVGTCRALPFVQLDTDAATCGLSALSAFACFPSASPGLYWYGYVPLR
jgi:hypothetical protein